VNSLITWIINWVGAIITFIVAFQYGSLQDFGEIINIDFFPLVTLLITAAFFAVLGVTLTYVLELAFVSPRKINQIIFTCISFLLTNIICFILIRKLVIMIGGT